MRAFASLAIILAMLGTARAADSCADSMNIYVSKPGALHNRTVKLEFARILKLSGVTAIVHVCEYVSGYESPHAIPWPSKKVPQFGVYFSQAIISTLSTEEMRGIIAHEIGHLHLWTTAFRGTLANPDRFEKYIDTEMRVDALAGTWVGANTVAKGLAAFGNYLLPLLPEAQRAKIKDELATRVGALSKSLEK